MRQNGFCELIPVSRNGILGEVPVEPEESLPKLVSIGSDELDVNVDVITGGSSFFI